MMRFTAIMAALSCLAACPEGTGEWLTAEGETECRPCIGLPAYSDTTPLPAGCPALWPGILWTVESDAAVAGNLEVLTRRAAGYADLAESMRRAATAAHAECADDLHDGARNLSQCSSTLRRVESQRWADRLLWGVAGIAIGVLATAAVAVSGG